jgi:hypothetical protein
MAARATAARCATPKAPHAASYTTTRGTARTNRGDGHPRQENGGSGDRLRLPSYGSLHALPSSGMRSYQCYSVPYQGMGAGCAKA